jgi:hypothetical protein
LAILGDSVDTDETASSSSPPRRSSCKKLSSSWSIMLLARKLRGFGLTAGLDDFVETLRDIMPIRSIEENTALSIRRDFWKKMRA